jgi:hypothetical protein
MRFASKSIFNLLEEDYVFSLILFWLPLALLSSPFLRSSRSKKEDEGSAQATPKEDKESTIFSKN